MTGLALALNGDQVGADLDKLVGDDLGVAVHTQDELCRSFERIEKPSKITYGRKLSVLASFRGRYSSITKFRPHLASTAAPRYAHRQKLLDGGNPLGIGGKKRVVPDGVLCPFDVGLIQWMRRVFEPVVADIARCDAEESRIAARRKTD